MKRQDNRHSKWDARARPPPVFSTKGELRIRFSRHLACCALLLAGGIGSPIRTLDLVQPETVIA